ncbi:MAG: hypothetical protein HY700_04500 [Gemmatimonadetes bacterium]|nr:hypothetical protein [Gemmatimonadota bacterium]
MTDVETRVERFAQRLESALGANLASLMLYGSAARDQYVAGRSDINLLMIVRDASTSALHLAAATLAEWTRKGETAPLIFSDEEWRASADVFPLEIEDMRDAHRVLRGRDPLDGLATDRDQLREQLEREVRGKLLHLRTEYAAAAGHPRVLEQLMQNASSTFLVFFRAILRLKGAAPPRDGVALVRETAKATGLNAAPFEWALESRSGRRRGALKPFDPVAAQYMDGVEQLARIVNAL